MDILYTDIKLNLFIQNIIEVNETLTNHIHYTKIGVGRRLRAISKNRFGIPYYTFIDFNSSYLNHFSSISPYSISDTKVFLLIRSSLSLFLLRTE